MFAVDIGDDSMLDRGRLLVNVYNVNIGKPLAGAAIRVFNHNDNAILEGLTTDNSGKSDVLTLSCPPRDFSMTYGIDYPKPYSQYDLAVVMDGFEPQRVLGVEILDDTTAIQNVFLSPRSRNNNDTQPIVIREHSLYASYPAKLPEDEIKPLPPASGYIVLDKPVIPETIVVHDGLPDDKSAKNYYVPFKDYIKNVASSEIYSTWPASTIRANVLAILSFTLNRVYTEWYRGRGKDFTITSSTAYDHAFSYGRNIFHEISVIVDEIFTTYITKPNIRQPLFSQYCDGRKSQCPNWMNQWGSKDLGDKGHDHISILKNYYGHDIYLEQAEKVAGIPASFPGTVLQTGSVGNGVRTIQEQLNVISKNFPAIPKLKEDGICGNDMVTAVKMFQKVFDQPQSGVVDNATWYKISNIYVAVMKLAELI